MPLVVSSVRADCARHVVLCDCDTVERRRGWCLAADDLQQACRAIDGLEARLEYRDVSLRAERLKATKLSGAEVLELIEAIEAFAEPVEVTVKTRPLSPDPDDDMVLDVALNGRADALVTNNTRHFAAAGRRFGVVVLTPAEMLERIRRVARDVE